MKLFLCKLISPQPTFVQDENAGSTNHVGDEIAREEGVARRGRRGRRYRVELQRPLLEGLFPEANIAVG